MDEPEIPDDLRDDIFATGDDPSNQRRLGRLVYQHAHHTLSQKIFGHEPLVDRLALAATQHIVAPHSAQRFVLMGPTGCGKTTAAMALGACVRRPIVKVSVEEMTATGWTGTQLGDCLGDIDRQALEIQRSGIGGGLDLLRSEAVIVLDEIDKVSAARHEGVSWSHQTQKQHSLLGVLARNGQVIASPDAKHMDIHVRTLSTARMMVISCGVFDGLDTSREPTPEELAAAGFLPELVERMGELIRMGPLGPGALADLFMEGLEPTCEHFALHGYVLDVTLEALAFTARLVGAGHGGPRSGVTWLRTAADRGLGSLLKAGAPDGSKFTLTPDDMNVAVRRSKPPEPPADPKHPSPTW